MEATGAVKDAPVIRELLDGEAPVVADVQVAKTNCHLPVILGSGISADNINEFYREADGFIGGSSFKVDGFWSNTIEPSRVTTFMSLVSKLQSPVL